MVTADSGDDSMLVIWDSLTGTPVRTYLNPHPSGVRTMDLSANNRYIVTVSADEHPQTMSLWDWTNEDEEEPIVSLAVLKKQEKVKATFEPGPFFWVKFNPDNHHEIVVNDKARVYFCNLELGVRKFQYFSPTRILDY